MWAVLKLRQIILSRAAITILTDVGYERAALVLYNILTIRLLEVMCGAAMQVEEP